MLWRPAFNCGPTWACPSMPRTGCWGLPEYSPSCLMWLITTFYCGPTLVCPSRYSGKPEVKLIGSQSGSAAFCPPWQGRIQATLAEAVPGPQKQGGRNPPCLTAIPPFATQWSNFRHSSRYPALESVPLTSLPGSSYL